MFDTDGCCSRSAISTPSCSLLTWTSYQILRVASCRWRAVGVYLYRDMTRDMAYHEIAPLLKVHHKLPQIPKEARATTGNAIWKIAPGRELATMNSATMPYPIQTQSQACHHQKGRAVSLTNASEFKVHVQEDKVGRMPCPFLRYDGQQVLTL
jgi:hypothetical protein